MMHYKIVGVFDDRPEEPKIFYGTFQEYDEEPCLTALVAQFGEPGKPAVECLHDWSGGEVKYWAEDLAEDPNSMEFMCLNGDYTYQVKVSHSPIKVVRPILLTEEERKLLLWALRDGGPLGDMIVGDGHPWRLSAVTKQLAERLE